MSGYAFHPDAFADLDEIWEYIDIRVRNLIKLLRLPA
jgi:hypothetical protein